MKIEIIILTLANIGIFTIGLFTLSKNARSATNLLFGLICLSLIGWTTANFYSLHLHQPENIFASIKIIFAFVVLQNTSFLLFTKAFPSSRLYQSSWWDRLYVLAGFLLMVGAADGLYFRGYTYQDKHFSILPSPFIGLFIAFAIVSIGTGLWRLVSRYKKARGVLRNQLLYLLIASVLLLVLVPITNFLLPIAFSDNAFVAYSPIYTLLFTAIIAYAVVRQKLFDIRLVVATSAAYVMSLATLGVIYGVFIYVLSQVVLGQPKTNLASELATITMVVLLAFLFQPVKKFFDRFTNSIFYRDAYDSQEVLDAVNKLLTRDINLNPITSQSLRVICQQLKIRRGMFVTVDKNRIFHTAVFQQQPHEIGLAELRNFTKTVTVASDLMGGHSKHILEKYGYEAALRLSTQDGVFGYILLSEKQSGNIFVSQDIRLLSLIASELAVGVQNAMAVEDIRQFNVTLRQKIEEATKELRQANSKLKELDHTKDEFISMASHQLRTPLTTIKGYLSMVLEGDVGPVSKNERQMIQQAFDSAERMVYLIADLLNVSRLQSGKFVIENKPTDLIKLVRTEVEQLKETAGHHQLKLTCSTPDKLPLFNLDETKIRQVVMNFLDNAIYYTPAGGSISVSLEISPKTVSYTVTDTGLGVPKQEQHHLFSKFYRAGNARKMRPDGTGLGLFMAKKVITAQGGAIIFKSEEGKGSTFGFSFPRAEVEIRGGSVQ